MAEERGKCKYHSDEENYLCSFTGRTCFGAYFDEFEQKYVIDIWKEQECPQYRHIQDVELNSLEGPSGFDLKNVFEEQKRETLAQAGVEVRQDEVSSGEGTVEVVLFGSRVPQDCEDGSCDLPETIDVDAEVLQHYLNRKYGEGKVKVEWVDVLGEGLEDYPEVSEYIAQHQSYPLVTINGVIKFVGSISVDLIKKELSRLGLEEAY